MDAAYIVMLIVVLVILVTIALLVWLWYRDPYYLIDWWNRRIALECDAQDAEPLYGIPSYHDAWNCSNRTARELQAALSVHHDQILTEVLETMQTYSGLSMVDLDEVQRSAFGDETRWKPIWIRFLGDWAGTADRVPTLKRIVEGLPGVSLLHVSIFYPGTTLTPHRGPSRVVHRFHYGLKIPEGDVGLRLAGHEIKWHEREGFIWDDTLPHSAWNHTESPRIVIFADIFREFSGLNALGSNLMYSLVQRTKHVKEIKQRLAQEGINVD